MFFIHGFGQNSLFLGSSISYVNIGDLDVTGNQLTVEALIQYTGPSVNIVSKHTGPPDVNYLLRPGNFEITTTNGYANVVSGVPLQAGETYHLAATYNGNVLRYFINGCLTNEIPLTGNMITNNVDVAIGQQSVGEAEQFIGYIDEVRIWNVARTENQIADNMLNLPNPATEVGLLGYYQFEGNYINVQGDPTFNGTPIGPTQLQTIPYPYPTRVGVTATSSPAVCGGTNTGYINVAGNGGYTPYEFSVDGVNYVNDPNFSNLAPGNYTVFARSNPNCVASTTITIEDQPDLISDLQVENVDCNGNNNGTAEINPSGGNGADYSWEWSTSNDTDLNIQSLPPDNYSVTLRDSCKKSGQELVVNGHFENGNQGISSDHLSCSDCFETENDMPAQSFVVGHDASLHHSVFEGTGNGGSGNFMMVNGATVPNQTVWCQTISVLPNSYYNLSFAVSSLVPDSPAELQFTIDGIPLNPAVTAPNTIFTWEEYSNSWFSGASTSVDLCIINNNLDDIGNDFGIDDISMKLCASCEITENFAVTEPTVLTIDPSTTNPQCLEDNGTISLEGQGGTAPYEYSIDNGVTFQSSGNFTDLAPDSYEVVVQDDNDCVATLTIELINEGGPTVDAGSDIEICIGESITLSGTGASSYTWDNGVQDGVPFTPATTTTYTVTGTDAFNCTDTDQVTVTVNALPSIDAGADQDVCDGASVTLEGQGGISYTWDNGVLDGVPFTPTASATYTVTGVDANNCENTDQVELTLYELSGVSSSQAETCIGNNGSASILISGGISPYTYNWQPGGASTPELQGIPAGSYTVTVTDAGGCEYQETIQVGAPNVVTLTVDQTINPTCAGGTDGQISVSPSGGDAPYVYNWNPNSGTTGSISGLSGGTYTVTVTDNGGCTATEVITLNPPAPIVISPLVVASDCGQNNGEITWNVSGGVPAYEYIWSPGVAIGNTASNLSPGTYSVQVIDGNGCTQSSTINLTEVGGLTVDITPNTVDITEGDSVQINVTTNSTSSTIDYSWSPTNGLSCTDCPDPTASPDESTIYSVEIIDGNGCQGSAESEIIISAECNGIFFPNMFSPNNDGLNDNFCILANCISGIEFRIYNRFGETMFTSFSTEDCWDGTHRNKPVNSGAYVYQLIYTENGEEKVASGSITLVR